MTNLENYRSSTEYREILRILQKATTDQGNIFWQSNALGKTVVPIRYIECRFPLDGHHLNSTLGHHRG